MPGHPRPLAAPGPCAWGPREARGRGPRAGELCVCVRGWVGRGTGVRGGPSFTCTRGHPYCQIRAPDPSVLVRPPAPPYQWARPVPRKDACARCSVVRTEKGWVGHGTRVKCVAQR